MSKKFQKVSLITLLLLVLCGATYSDLAIFKQLLTAQSGINLTGSLTMATAASKIVPGATSISLRNNADNADNLKVTDAGNVTFRGTMIGTGTSSLGWAVVSGANVECTTTCVTPAVFGFDLAAGATSPVLVGPSDATADVCLCAGAS